jgi:hypothetical protein
MPFTPTYVRCRIDSAVDAALISYQERLGERLLETRRLLGEVAATSAALSTDYLVPLRRDLDATLAIADTSTEALIDASGMITGETSEDIESTFTDRFGLLAVEGRIIPAGTVDLRPIKILARLVGGLEGIRAITPELEGVVIDPGSERSYRRTMTFTRRFIFAATYMKRTVIAASKCDPEKVIEVEVTAGIDVPISRAALTAGVPASELKLYIIWLGRPEASELNRAKARLLGFTNDQFVDMVSLTSRGNLFVYKIDDPMDIARVSGAFGDDADAVIDRARGPVSLDATALEVARVLRDSLSRSSGGAGPSGFQDFTSPSASLVGVIDINKTFRLSDTFASIRQFSAASTGPAQQFAEGVAGALQAQLDVMQAVLDEIQGTVTQTLNELTNLQNVVNTVFNDQANGLFNCLFGSGFSPAFGAPAASASASITVGVGGFGGPGTPGTPGSSTVSLIESIISRVEGQVASIQSYIDSVTSVFSSASSISCMGSFVPTSFISQNSFSGGALECQSERLEAEGFELPGEMIDAMGAIKVAMDFMTSLFDRSIANLRSLRMSSVSLSLSLRLNLMQRNTSGSSYTSGDTSGSGGCAPPEVAQLISLLQDRALAGFTAGADISVGG